MLTIRQRFLKLIYPILITFESKHSAKGLKLVNTKKINPLVSFHSLTGIANNGKQISMNDFKGKKIILVNVASNCGFTNQYEDLEKLYKENQNSLIILGFPANDFNEQEIGTDEQIERFCKINFGVTFPLFKKQSVLKPNQNAIYQWLTDKNKNGWNEQEPSWNFCKYLIDENGILQSFSGSAIEPKDVLNLK